jgi:hypothetical protein
MKLQWHSFLARALLSCIVLPGCAFMDAHVNPEFSMEPGKRSPLGTIAPMAISIQVEDQRSPFEQDRVGDKKNNFGSVTAKVISDKAPSSILYDALRAEFEANNHKIVKPDNGNADVLLKVGLKRYWSDFSVHFFEIEMKGSLETDIGLFNAKNQEQIASIPLNSTFRESRQMALDGAFEDALRGALSEYVRSFSRDPNILDAFRSAQKEKQ